MRARGGASISATSHSAQCIKGKVPMTPDTFNTARHNGLIHAQHTDSGVTMQRVNALRGCAGASISATSHSAQLHQRGSANDSRHLYQMLSSNLFLLTKCLSMRSQMSRQRGLSRGCSSGSRAGILALGCRFHLHGGLSKFQSLSGGQICFGYLPEFDICLT